MVAAIVETLSRLPVAALLILSAGSVIFGDYAAKYWSTGTGSKWYFLALLGALGSSFFWTPTLLREGLVETSIIWTILSSAGFLFIGLVLFNETLTTIQIIGVVLGLVSILLLTL